MISRRQEWLETFAKDMLPKGGYPSIVDNTQKEGVFLDWGRMKAPCTGDYWLNVAIDAACGDCNHPYVYQFIDWSITCCERSLIDPRFEIESEDQKKGWKNDSYLDRHGLTLETLALANAFKHNADIDADRLIQAAQERTQFALNTAHWDYMEQFRYLVYAQFHLIVGRVDLAREQLKTRKKFKQVQRYYDWLKAFINAIPDEGVITDIATIEAFQDRFDEIRSPLYQLSSDFKNGLAVSYSRPQLRLQLALIKQRYIIGKPLAGNWQAVIGYISE